MNIKNQSWFIFTGFFVDIQKNIEVENQCLAGKGNSKSEPVCMFRRVIHQKTAPKALNISTLVLKYVVRNVPMVKHTPYNHQCCVAADFTFQLTLYIGIVLGSACTV